MNINNFKLIIFQVLSEMLQFDHTNLVASADKLFILTEKLTSVERNFPKVDSGNIWLLPKLINAQLGRVADILCRLCLKNEKSALYH